MGRRLELDAVRGLMLVWMVMTHLPTKLPTYANQPFGFISATEGFIFLSALFTGRIYVRLAERSGYGAMRRKLLVRTVRLYGYHGLLLALAFFIAVPIAAHGNRPGLHNLLDFYFTAGARRAIVDAALLIYRPALLDILPMYIMFLLITPLVLSVKKESHWKYVMGASLIVWLLAQFGLRQAVYEFARLHLGLQIPMKEMGAFDVWAWQFMWILGLRLGERWAKGDLPAENWAKRFALPAALIFAVFFAFRYIAAFMNLDFGRWAPLFDIRFQSALKPLAFRPLVLLGQASLQVFCIHLLFCFAGLTIMGPNDRLTDWRQYALLAATLAAMFATAQVFSKSEFPDQGEIIMLPSAVSLTADENKSAVSPARANLLRARLAASRK
jgi:hypothetical protein